MCSFFVVPRNRQPLLGISYIETLGILTINCNTIEIKEADGPEKCKTNTSQEGESTEEHYANTDNVAKFENEDKPMVIDNDNNNIKIFPSKVPTAIMTKG